jgi:hypothetical protein
MKLTERIRHSDFARAVGYSTDIPRVHPWYAAVLSLEPGFYLFDKSKLIFDGSLEGTRAALVEGPLGSEKEARWAVKWRNEQVRHMYPATTIMLVKQGSEAIAADDAELEKARRPFIEEERHERSRLERIEAILKETDDETVDDPLVDELFQNGREYAAFRLGVLRTELSMIQRGEIRQPADRAWDSLLYAAESYRGTLRKLGKPREK